MQQFPATKQIKNYLYSPQSLLGRGSFSTVYLGQHITTNQPAAIKVIDVKSNKTDIERLLIGHQIRALKLMNHQNVMKTYEVYQTTNNIYIVSQYCELGDLSSMIKGKGRMGEEQALNVIVQILLGVIHIHGKGVVHRDLKPQNILIKNGVKEPVYKIIDFGFCDINQFKIQQQQQQSYNVGSPLYMSPEAYRKSKYSTRSDLWAVGVIMLEMLLGDLPFRGVEYDVLVQQIESGEVIRGLSCGQGLKGIIGRMLSSEEKRIEPTEVYNLITAYRTQLQKNSKGINQNLKIAEQQNKNLPQQPNIDQSNKPLHSHNRRQFMQHQKHLRGSLVMNHSPAPKPRPRDISPTRNILDKVIPQVKLQNSPSLLVSTQFKTLAQRKLKLASDLMSLLAIVDEIKPIFTCADRIILLSLKMTKQYLEQTTSIFQQDSKVLNEQQQESLKNHITNFNLMQVKYNHNTLFADLYFSFNLEYLRLEGEYLNYLQFWIKTALNQLEKLGEIKAKQFNILFSKGYVIMVKMCQILECLKKNPTKIETVSQNKMIESLIKENIYASRWTDFNQLQEKLKIFKIE